MASAFRFRVEVRGIYIQQCNPIDQAERKSGSSLKGAPWAHTMHMTSQSRWGLWCCTKLACTTVKRIQDKLGDG